MLLKGIKVSKHELLDKELPWSMKGHREEKLSSSLRVKRWNRDLSQVAVWFTDVDVNCYILAVPGLCLSVGMGGLGLEQESLV